MGENKALLVLAGRQLIEYPLTALFPLTSQLAIITNDPARYKHLQVSCYGDRWQGCGPLAGIGTALAYADNDYMLTVACDMPFISMALLRLLIEQRGDATICLPQSAEGYLQPLCALYHRGCQPIIEQLIAQGEYSPRALFAKVETKILPFATFSHLPGAALFFENLNTKDDFLRAQTYFANKKEGEEL